MKLSEQMSYLKGLVDGMEIDLTTKEGKVLKLQMQMTSPIPYLTSTTNGDSAPYWYVRHGMADRDTSFALQTVLYYALTNDKYQKQQHF